MSRGVWTYVILMAGTAYTAWATPARTADYMPPPLFGEPTPITKITPDLIVPVAPPPPVPSPTPAVVVPITRAPEPKPVVLPNLPPPMTAATRPLPETTGIIPASPSSITVDDLLAHPAGSIDARAKAALSTKAPSGPTGVMNTHRPAGLAKPILENDPSAPPSPTPVTVAPAPKKPAPRPAVKPDVPLERAVVVAPAPKTTIPDPSKAAPPSLMDYDMPDLSNETPVDAVINDPAIPENAVTIDDQNDQPPETENPAPAPVVTKPSIVSPSATVKKVVTQNPKVMVYSRDKETGEFKKLDRPDILISPTVQQKNGLHPPPPPSASTMQKSPDPLAELVVPLTAEQISKGLLNDDVAGVVPTAPKQKTKNPATIAPLATLDLPFSPGDTELNDDLRRRIDQAVVAPMIKDSDKGVELHAFAKIVGDEPASDRRIALARGLAVRDYLMTQNISGGRINLKVMTGSDATSGTLPPDRVEFWVK
jgi:hypothetical protein